jgi:hypothetical protein
MAPHTPRRAAADASRQDQASRRRHIESIIDRDAPPAPTAKRRQLQQWADQHQERAARFYPSEFITRAQWKEENR